MHNIAIDACEFFNGEDTYILTGPETLYKNTSAGLASRGNEAELNMTLCGAQSTYL